jgi:hypothetical protein
MQPSSFGCAAAAGDGAGDGLACAGVGLACADARLAARALFDFGDKCETEGRGASGALEASRETFETSRGEVAFECTDLSPRADERTPPSAKRPSAQSATSKRKILNLSTGLCRRMYSPLFSIV